RAPDQGRHSGREGDDPRPGRRWRSLCGGGGRRKLPRQEPRAAAPDGLQRAEGQYGRRSPRARPADQRAGVNNVRRQRSRPKRHRQRAERNPEEDRRSQAPSPAHRDGDQHDPRDREAAEAGKAPDEPEENRAFSFEGEATGVTNAARQTYRRATVNIGPAG